MGSYEKVLYGRGHTPQNPGDDLPESVFAPRTLSRSGKDGRATVPIFEMLGNFSFGDYFKHEATAWAWEFCTKVLEMPEDKLWVTIYQDDDEAFRDLDQGKTGLLPSHIVRLGKEDNFWEHGSGPCGPCSEIYFDRGREILAAAAPDCGRRLRVRPVCRVLEPLCSASSNHDGKGNYTALKQPNIDTGMGLERLACILAGGGQSF